MRNTITWLFMLVLAFAARPTYCQVIDVSRADSTNRFPITEFTSYLQTSDTLSIDSVVMLQQLFVPSQKKPVMIFNYDPYYYWFRIILRNDLPEKKDMMLLMAPVGLYDGRLMQRIDREWTQVAHAGLKYRFRDRSYQFTHHVYPFTLPPGRVDTLFLSIHAKNVYKSFGFALLRPKELKIFEDNVYFVFGIIEGLLILFFFLNLSLYIALKEKLHLWYSLYIVFLFLIVMKNDHLDQQFLGFDSELAFRLTPYMAIGAFAIALLMYVVQHFLKETLEKNKWLYGLTTILRGNVICSAIAHALFFGLSNNSDALNFVFGWAQLSTSLGIFSIMANCIYCLLKGFKGALFILFGTSVFMLGSIQRIYFPVTLSFLFPPTTFHIGIIVETFVITLGLIYRYWWGRQKIENETKESISRDIHDNIAPLLTLANISIDKVGVNNQHVEDTKMYVGKAGIDIRNISRKLKKEDPKKIDILPQIRAYCQSFGKAGRFKVELITEVEGLEVGNDIEFVLMPVFLEVLQNAFKHSQATLVQVTLCETLHSLLIQIHDNGVGFKTDSETLNSNGLNNISKRCQLLNATCEFESECGKGTTISIEMPVK